MREGIDRKGKMARNLGLVTQEWPYQGWQGACYGGRWVGWGNRKQPTANTRKRVKIRSRSTGGGREASCGFCLPSGPPETLPQSSLSMFVLHCRPSRCVGLSSLLLRSITDIQLGPNKGFLQAPGAM